MNRGSAEMEELIKVAEAEHDGTALMQRKNIGGIKVRSTLSEGASSAKRKNCGSISLHNGYAII